MAPCKRKYLVGILFIIIAPAILVFCQKKMFARVTVKGRALHYFTSQPLSGIQVKLLADDHRSAKSQDNDIALDETTTGDDGGFTLRSRASKSDEYFLSIEDLPYPKRIPISINNKGETDIGDFLAGSQDFYCRIALTSTSGNCVFIRQPGSDHETRVSPGTNTSVLLKNTYNSEQFNNLFLFSHRTGDCGSSGGPLANNKNEALPIVSSDTIRFAISF